MTDDDPRRYGVTLADIRSSLAFEVDHGRGPGSPERIEQEKAERAEVERLVEWNRNRPRYERSRR